MKAKELQAFREVRVAESAVPDLPDLSAVRVAAAEPVDKRLLRLAEQLGNPYLFQAAGLAVKINFTGGRKLAEALAEALRPS